MTARKTSHTPDYLRAAHAAELMAMIAEHWQQRGCTVNLRLELIVGVGGSVAIRSDMFNGLPRDAELTGN